MKIADHYSIKTESDIEKYLYYVLSSIENNQTNSSFIEKYIESIRDLRREGEYTGVNSFAIMNDYFLVVNEFKSDPKYLTLNYTHLEDEDILVVASDPIPISSRWNEMNNGDFLYASMDKPIQYTIRQTK